MKRIDWVMVAVLALTLALTTPVLAKSDNEKGNNGKEDRWSSAGADYHQRGAEEHDRFDQDDRDDDELSAEERAQKRLEKQQRKLEKQQKKVQKQQREQTHDLDGISGEQKNKQQEKLTGLEKQRQRKAEQVQKEVNKGSEQGQKAREKRKKWYQFWN